MPTKETNTTFYICTGEERYILLNQISEVSLSEEDIKGMEYEKFSNNEEIFFEIKAPKSCRELMNFIELIHPNLSWIAQWEKRYGSNNWRKLHGLPMKRQYGRGM